MKKIKKQIEEIFNKPISCHPGREDDIRFKEAILLLAEKIDLLIYTNPYDLESLSKQLKDKQ